ncbi:MAG TPA: GC-type dockerin domain-anchored protein [Phycisphaerales bacterium]|nr:GC-type dockerin domain-anchored protein [Phycisphaerales bacterium]
MKTILLMSLCTITLCASHAHATDPSLGGPMKHVMVRRLGTALSVTIDDSVPTPVLRDDGEEYEGPAAVLNGRMHNAQYGWMVSGFWTLPPGSQLWIEQVSTFGDMWSYSGGAETGIGSFAPIFGTEGTSPRIAWNGVMLHNWYAAETVGAYEATYRVYFGDSAGVPTPGFTAAEVTLTWVTQGCGADFDASGFIDTDDFDAFVVMFMAGDELADFDGSGFVDTDDFDAFVRAFETGC